MEIIFTPAPCTNCDNGQPCKTHDYQDVWAGAR